MAPPGVKEMPATSVCCRRSASKGLRPAGERAAVRGFTLLELLVVMAILALVLGVVGPAAWRALAAAQERGAERALAARLHGLPVRAWQSGQALAVEAAELTRDLEGWPAGWVVTLDEPLQYGPDGVAKGGTVRLIVEGRPRATWRVEPLSGRVGLAS